MSKKQIKHKKHDKLINDYENQKSKHLEKLTNKMLKKDEKNSKLKEKTINFDFFKLFKK